MTMAPQDSHSQIILHETISATDSVPIALRHSHTQIILHKTIESVLERGARLDDLVSKSEDLSMASQLFYKQARKTNSCCSIM